MSVHLVHSLDRIEIGSNFAGKSSPYLVLRASANLIPGHNEIYNKNFVKFLSAYLNLYLQEKPDDTP